MRITVTSLSPKEKLTFVKTTEGQEFRCWNNKISQFGIEAGASYDVETDNTQYGVHITKAKRVAAGQVVIPAREPFTAGSYRPPATSPLSTPDAPLTKDEQIWVQGFVQAFIRSGEVSLDNFEEVVRKVRGVYKRTIGRDVIQRQMEAAE